MKKRTIIHVVGVTIVLLLIVGLGGCYFYSDLKKKDTTQKSEIKTDKEIPTRDQIEDRYKWNLADMYTNDGDWERDFKKVEIEYLPKFFSYQGQLANTQKLLDYFKLWEQTFIILDKMCVYSFYKQSEDRTNTHASEMYSKYNTLFSKASTAVAFVNPELIALPTKHLESLMKNSDFSDYRHYFDTLLKTKDHVLSRPQEELLAKSQDMSGTFNNVFDKATAADIQFPTIKGPKGEDIRISQAKYLSLLMNPDRDFRQRVATGLMASYGNFKNTLAENLNGQVKANIFYAQAKKYNNALEAALAGNFIPEVVYNNLIETVSKNLTPLHKYIALRKKVLNLDKVHVYDMYVPLAKDIDQKIPYEEGKKIVMDALAVLGPDYSNILKQGLENRWIDVYETKNKDSGASAWVAYGYHPYIKMNYDDTFDGVSMLSHEFGHAANFWYLKNQPYATFGWSAFNAEVASTLNELLTIRHMISNAKNDDEKLFYLNQLASRININLFVQTMFAEFEKSIHNRVENGEALSVDSLNKTWSVLIIKYMGPDYVLDDFSKIEWISIPHFYYKFYVYNYATAISAANQLVDNIIDQKPDTKEKYIEFLSAGNSDYPVEILKKAGVDMTTSAPIENLLKAFGEIVDEMEAILKKQGRL